LKKKSAGVLIQGIDPFNGYQKMEWFAFLRNQPGKKYFEKTASGKIKEALASDYEYPSGVPTRAFFFEGGNECWKMVASRYNRTISRFTLEQSHFWKWVIEKQIPIVICETPTKGMRLLSAGYAAITIPGVDSGIRNNTLIPELELFATAGRNIKICFDDSLVSGAASTSSALALIALFCKAGAKATFVTQRELLLNSNSHRQWAKDNYDHPISYLSNNG